MEDGDKKHHDNAAQPTNTEWIVLQDARINRDRQLSSGSCGNDQHHHKQRFNGHDRQKQERTDSLQGTLDVTEQIERRPMWTTVLR